MLSKKRTAKKDSSPYVFQSKKQDISFNIDCRVPWTEKQLEFIRLAQDKNTKLIFVNAPAGVGKSLLAVYVALVALKEKKISEIVYVRSLVESSSKSMGFLKGTIEDKQAPYTEPLLNKMDEIIGSDNAKILLERGLVVTKPINFLRGCQFTGKFVIGDEFQSVTQEEMLTFLSRIGEFSKVIVCGDPSQSDIGKRSALTKVFNLFDCEEARENGIFTIEFGEEDIMRSQILRFIVKKFKELDK